MVSAVFTRVRCFLPTSGTSLSSAHAFFAAMLFSQRTMFFLLHKSLDSKTKLWHYCQKWGVFD
jgi:hypothetical protein